MKIWPKELSDVVPDGEEINFEGYYEFKWDCDISAKQREVMRSFLFGLEKDEYFEYRHPELNRKFVVKLEGSASMQVSYKWDPDESKEKVYNLDMGVISKEKM